MTEYGPVLRVAELDKSRPREIEVTPDQATADQIAADLGISGARKIRLTGTLAPLGKRDWRFTGHLGATVVQPCVVTLDPVTTRLEEDIERSFIKGLESSEADESETPDDVFQDDLGNEIDFGAVLLEALSLALPDFPRADGAEVAETQFTEPGKDAMTDDDAKPFASLAALRDKLAGDDS